MTKQLVAVVAAVLVFGGQGVRSVCFAGEKAAVIGDKMDIGLEYTLTVDGSVIDSSEGRGPFHYIHGTGQIVPGLERQLAGLKVGDDREITVKPEEGYGAVDPAAFVDVPKAQLPEGATPTVGMMLQGMSPEGRPFRATIAEVKTDHVVLNLNHPLAGKTLLFKVKILTIAPAKG